MCPSIRHLVSAVLASLALSAPAAAQGFVYRDIAWGSDPQTTTNQLAAEGFALEEDFAPDEGEVMYTDSENENVIALASFAGDRLVGIRIAMSGENAEELWEQSVREGAEALGEPDEEGEWVATWHREGTTFTLMVGESDNGIRFLVAQYAGPGYEEEIQRRMGGTAEPAEFPALDERWVLLRSGADRRTVFDRATVQAMGNRVFRVWLRDDYTVPQVDNGTFDMELHQVDYDCAARRFRVGASTYQLGGQLVNSDTPPEPSEWFPIPPESVGEQIITGVCRVAEGR
ncbi:MAG TPA: surface-adhesin E family protein [Longimicrobium sp.]|nr:surface-adhesin E family protein [Longimicrobium sp.]